MNPQTMTCDECRDELARRAGWTFQSAFGNHWWRRVADGGDHEDSDAHPYPPTLDGADAAVLATGAVWERTPFEWLAWMPGSRVDGPFAKVDDTDKPIDDLYRLAVACLLAMEPTT